MVGRNVLLTIDADTPPDRLVYEVSSPAVNGQLVFGDRLNETIGVFTQKDIDDERVYFVQDGSRESAAFYFKVSDEQSLLTPFSSVSSFKEGARPKTSNAQTTVGVHGQLRLGVLV